MLIYLYDLEKHKYYADKIFPFVVPVIAWSRVRYFTIWKWSNGCFRRRRAIDSRYYILIWGNKWWLLIWMGNICLLSIGLGWGRKSIVLWWMSPLTNEKISWCCWPNRQRCCVLMRKAISSVAENCPVNITLLLWTEILFIWRMKLTPMAGCRKIL